MSGQVEKFWDWDFLKGVNGVTSEHERAANMFRKFIDEEVAPHVQEWEEVGDFPKDLYEKAYKAGMYGATWPAKF